MRLLPAAVLVSVLSLVACTTPQRPNVVVLLMDTLRADRLGCYGHRRDTSPTIDSLAAAGVRFTRAYATADYTQASTASLFTGLYPLAHGYVNADYVLPDEHLTLAEILAAQGYQTGGFIANGLAGRKYGMQQGFAHYVEHNQAGAEMLADSVVAFLRTAEEPYFVYAHFLDVHDPHRTPAAARRRFAGAGAGGFSFDLTDATLREQMHATAWWSAAQLWWPSESSRDSVAAYFADYERAYDGTIRYWDDQVKRIVAALRQSGHDGHTVLVLTSDHGEQLLDHGFFGHASSGYEEGLRVPLIWVDPAAVGGGQLVEAATSLADLLPTLLNRVQIPVPPDLQGRSRWPLAAATGNDTVYTEGTFFRNRPFSTLIQTYQQGGWKLILDRMRDVKELYDLHHDPLEERDLFGERPEVVAELYAGLRARYHESLSRFARIRRAASSPGGADAAKERELRALGYVGGGGGGSRRQEFFPLIPEAPGPFGPFGDEQELDAFQPRIDFTQGHLVGEQIVGGFADEVGQRHPRGLWFDRRATFLLRRDRAARSAQVDVDIDPAQPLPSRLEAWVDGAPVSTVEVVSDGPLSLDVPLPAALATGEFWQLELRADSRFVSRRGDSPREHGYASFRVQRIDATSTKSTKEGL